MTENTSIRVDLPAVFEPGNRQSLADVVHGIADEAGQLEVTTVTRGGSSTTRERYVGSLGRLVAGLRSLEERRDGQVNLAFVITDHRKEEFDFTLQDIMKLTVWVWSDGGVWSKRPWWGVVVVDLRVNEYGETAVSPIGSGEFIVGSDGRGSNSFHGTLVELALAKAFQAFIARDALRQILGIRSFVDGNPLIRDRAVEELFGGEDIPWPPSQPIEEWEKEVLGSAQ